MVFPDPIAFTVLNWPVRWYGLCYLGGIIITWWYCLRLLPVYFPQITRQNLEDLISWSILGIIVGGRLGYALLYAPHYFWENPTHIIQVWRGGMAFHGGLLGVFLACMIYSYREKISLKRIGDCIASAVPLALCLGRLGNFVNQEHWGRPTDMPWGIVFPHVDFVPRHPSQLYEAFAEGIALFGLLWCTRVFWKTHKKPGFLFGLFLGGYGIARIICEFCRTPDQVWTLQIGALGGLDVTSGQLFSLPLLAAGLTLCLSAHKTSRYAYGS